MSEQLPGEGSFERSKIRVQSFTEKGVGLMNEDARVIKRHSDGNITCAVIDGATSLDSYRDDDGNTGGYLAANIVKGAFENRRAPLKQIALEANRQINNVMLQKGTNGPAKENRWCAGFAAIEVGKDSFEWAQISDCLIVVIREDGSYRCLAQDYDHDKEWMVMLKDLHERGVQNVREELMPTVLETRRKANIEYGFLNGEEEATGFIQSGAESIEGVGHILLFTDGMFLPRIDPRQPEDLETMVSIFREATTRGEDGLRAIKNRVRDVENTDPECRAYPRFKKHDDMTAIALSF